MLFSMRVKSLAGNSIFGDTLRIGFDSSYLLSSRNESEGIFLELIFFGIIMLSGIVLKIKPW